VEGKWLESQDKPDEAQQAFERALERESDSFFTYYRLAALRARQPLDAAGLADLMTLLDRSLALNGDFGPSLAFASSIAERQNRLDRAFDFAQRAVRADPVDMRYRAAAARLLAKMSRPDEARRVALDAMKYVDNGRDRAELQAVLDSVSTPTPEPASRPATVR
jgi:tetratricopeptide (TPR) repeat protein